MKSSAFNMGRYEPSREKVSQQGWYHKYRKHLMHMQTSEVQHTRSHLPAPWDWWAGQCFLEVHWVCYCWRWALAEEDHTHTLAALTAGSGYSTATFKQNTLQHLSQCYSSGRNIYLENFILTDQRQHVFIKMEERG